MKKCIPYITGFLACLIGSLAFGLWWLPKKTERIREEALLISALKHCMLDTQFFCAMSQTTNDLPAHLARDHAKVYLTGYKLTYEEALEKSVLPEENFFTPMYKSVCSYLEE